MNTTRREEKEVIIPRKKLTAIPQLDALCLKHQVEVDYTKTAAILKLNQDSSNLLEFSGAIERYGILVRMTDDQKAAFLRDLATLECP
jgi:hypothetical protein